MRLPGIETIISSTVIVDLGSSNWSKIFFVSCKRKRKISIFDLVYTFGDINIHVFRCIQIWNDWRISDFYPTLLCTLHVALQKTVCWTFPSQLRLTRLRLSRTAESYNPRPNYQLKAVTVSRVDFLSASHHHLGTCVGRTCSVTVLDFFSKI